MRKHFHDAKIGLKSTLARRPQKDRQNLAVDSIPSSSGSDVVAKNQLSESSTLASIAPVPQKEEGPEEKLSVGDAATGNDGAAPFSVEESTPTTTEEPLLDSTPVVEKTGKAWQIASNAIWKQAYDKFQTEQKDLHDAYQQLLVSEPESTQNLDVKAQAASLAESQQKRMEDRQWTFRAWGSSKPRKVRDTIEGILTTTKNASSLISVGITFAPVYVSLPWSAVSALIPFLMRDVEQQKDALQGVQDITRIMHGYNIAESTYLQDSSLEMHQRFADAVLELYVSLLVYQTKVAQYFGAKTAANLAKNALLQGVTWKEESLTISTRDSEAQRNLSFLGPALVEDLFRRQKQNFELILRGISSQRDRDDAVLKWLSPNTPFDGHIKVQKALGEHYVSSSQWIFGLKNFDHWLHSEDQIMFLEGGVGSGKSSVTFSIIEKLLRGTHGQLAFFYCSNTGVDEGSTSSIVKSLIRQCAKDGNGETLKVPAQDIYEDDRANYPDRCELDVGKSFDLLKELVDLSQSTTIVIDGLDECEDVEVLLFHLRKLWDETSSKLRIFLSSRYGHLPTVTEHFYNASHIEISDRNSEDIEAYLRTEIPPSRTGRRLRNAMTDEQANTLRSVLQSRARGMFIWVTLQVEVFLPRELRARPKTQEDVASKLSLLVSSTANTIDSLRQVYDQVYQIAVGPTDQPRRKSMVETALRMVICSYRPLTLSELAHVAAIYEHGVSKDIKDQPELLLEVCSNLLAEDPAGFMRFSHLSVKEYLEHRTPSINAVGSFGNKFCNRQAATSCLRLKSSLQGANTPRELISLTNDINLVGFPTYAKTYWPRHFLDAGEQADVAELIIYLKAQPGGLERFRTLRLTLDDTSENLHVSNFRNIVDLDIKLRQAARSGMENEVEALIALGADVHSRDIYGNTILHEAVDWGQRSITEVVLVNSGLHPRELINAANESGNTAYHRAMFWGNQGVIQIIAGHSPSLAPNMNFMSPLDVARFEERLVSNSEDTGQIDHASNMSSETPFFASKILVSGPRSHDHQGKIMPKASSSILFDARSLCSCCDLASWFENPSRGIYHPHHRTYVDLEISARSGCDLCTLFAKEILLKGYHLIDDDMPSSCVSIRLLLSAEEGSSSGPQDLLVVLVGENLKATFELFTGTGTFKADFEPVSRLTPDLDVVERLTTKISGRPIAPSLGDESCFDLARTWISNCETSHEFCRYNETVPLPERVLRIEGDLHSKSFRLRTCRPVGEYGRFVYLSHIPGSVRPPILLTTNLEEKLAGRYESADLPPSWQNALYAIMQMGFRYVWIDSLCIIQDCIQDWEHQGALMPQYISDSALVLALSSEDTSDLFVQRPTGTLLNLEWTCERNMQRSGCLSIRRPLKGNREAILRSPLASRAWLFQETVLSQRVLHYGMEQIYWNCQTHSLSEGNSRPEGPLRKFASRLRSIAETTDSHLYSDFGTWYALVEEYCQKTLAFASDRLPAFSSIARMFYTIGDNYLAGLWERDLLRGLLWRAEGPATSPMPSSRFCAPSWSWASSTRNIQYQAIKGVRMSLSPPETAVIISAKFTRSRPDIFGALTSGHLVLQALSQDSNFDLRSSSCSYYFDTEDFEDQWRSGQTVTCILIAKWSLALADMTSRWMGLILSKTDYDHATYRRVGFLEGPAYEEHMAGWEMQVLTII